ncbi:hypothetical protein Tco_1407239 [Tanacetum coccineum]
MESSNSNSKERELQLTQRLVKLRHSHCMTWFERLEIHLRDLYLNSSSHDVDAFKPAFRSFFGEEHQTFRLKMFHNLDHMDVKALHADLVVMESKGTESGKHDTRSSSENYITHAVDADIRPVNDQVPLVEITLRILVLFLTPNTLFAACKKSVFNANHDELYNKIPERGVNTRATVQSPKTRKQQQTRRNQRGYSETGRKIAIGQRWIPTGKMFIDSTTKVDSEPPNGSNEDIINPYECDQTLNVSADNTSGPVAQRKESTSQTTQEEQSHVIPTSVEEDDHGIEVAHMDNDL